MNQLFTSKVFAFLAFLLLFASSLACGFDLGGNTNSEQVGLQQTVVALQQTQAALENQDQEPSQEPPTETVTNTPTPTDTPQVPDVNYEGINFSFEQNVAQNIVPATVPGQNMGEDYMPGDTYPTYIEFSFDTYAVSDHFHEPKIRVYPIEEFRIINPSASAVIDNLKLTLENQPAGNMSANLPFLPIWNAAQLFAASVEYFDFQNGSGLRYLTMYGQGLSPVDNKNLFYTFQGMTDDGRFYISAVLPVINSGLPNDGASQIDDWMAFEENWETYLADTIAWLEAQPSQNFLPNLESLDSMIASLNVNP
jgi:hypothetical protein